MVIKDRQLHREGCLCDDDKLSWTCYKCGEERAPCWAGGVNDDHDDICGVCLFRETHYEDRVKLTTISSARDETEAMLIAAQRGVDHMPLIAIPQGRGTGWYVVSISQAILTAWNNSRRKCSEEHAGPWDGSWRCMTCGEVDVHE